MKKTIVKVIVMGMLLSTIAGLLSGCFLKKNIMDGPGMVNYPGIMLEALLGDWQESDDGDYSIIFADGYTCSLSYNHAPLLENAQLTLYLDNMDTNAYSEFDVSPNVFTDAAGGSLEITKASHENGVVTLEFTATDGTKSTRSFCRMPADMNVPETADSAATDD